MAEVLIINDSFKITKKTNHVKFSATVYLEFENFQDEFQSFSIGMPADWKAKYLDKLNIKNYDIYYLISKTVTHGCFNAITDKKKVWGLCEIDPQSGVFDCSYESANGKTYLGAIRTKAIIDNGYGLFILIPKGKSFPIELVKTALVNEKYELGSCFLNQDKLLSKLQSKIPDSIIICGSGDQASNVSLDIYAKEVDKLF